MDCQNMFDGFKKKNGLQRKIFRLCVGIITGAIVVFAVIGIMQLRLIFSLATETSNAQNAVIKEKSREAMRLLLEDSLKGTVAQAAKSSDDEFSLMRHDYYVLASQVQDVFLHPENYQEIEVNPPSKANGGEYSAQLMFADWADQRDKEMMTMVRKLGNLTPMMAEIIRGNSDYTMDCYIALPGGATIAVDAMSDQKFEEDGRVKAYDATTRAWYQGAVENGDIYFSPAIHSFFYDLTEVVFGMPVYVDGKLVAVLEGSTKLDSLQQLTSEIIFGETGFSILVSGDGQLVYSPRKSGDLAMDDMLSTDIRATENKPLRDLVLKALSMETGFTTVTIDSELFYVAYAPLETLGWTQMMFVSASELANPSEKLLEEMDVVTAENLSSFSGKYKKFLIITAVAVVLLVLNAAFMALFFSKKIVNPLLAMTQGVKGIEGDDMTFELKDEYKNVDEIETLATSFNKLTFKLRDYIDEVTKISAEKERIDTEMATANQIQDSMLPRIFPAFPDRPEFSLYADMKPAKEVGGDLYDYYFIDDDHLAIVIGDVSGKGISAALFMVMTKHIIQSQVMLKDGNVIEALDGVNTLLMEENAAGMFVTVWLGVLNVKTGHMEYVNAGHEYPIIYRNGERFELYKDNHGAPVACTKKIKLKPNSLDLDPGDILYLYTDGITEATNADLEMFGQDRVIEALNENVELEVHELDKAVRTAVDKFVGDAEQFDDMTTLCIRFKGP